MLAAVAVWPTGRTGVPDVLAAVAGAGRQDPGACYQGPGGRDRDKAALRRGAQP